MYTIRMCQVHMDLTIKHGFIRWYPMLFTVCVGMEPPRQGAAHEAGTQWSATCAEAAEEALQGLPDPITGKKSLPVRKTL